MLLIFRVFYFTEKLSGFLSLPRVCIAKINLFSGLTFPSEKLETRCKLLSLRCNDVILILAQCGIWMHGYSTGSEGLMIAQCVDEVQVMEEGEFRLKESRKKKLKCLLDLKVFTIQLEAVTSID